MSHAVHDTDNHAHLELKLGEPTVELNLGEPTRDDVLVDVTHTGLIQMSHLQADVDDALLAARHKLDAAQARLDEAHDEAQAIVSDAIEQATLIARSAELAAESLLPRAEQEATEIIAKAHAEAEIVRHQSDQLLVEARTVRSDAHLGLDLELEQRRAEHELQLQAERNELAADLERSQAAAEQDFVERHADAHAAVAQLLASAKREHADATVDADMMRAQARKESRILLETSHADAARDMTAAAEQTLWAKQVVTGLVDAAELDAQRIRKAAHLDAASATARARTRLAALLDASGEARRRRQIAADEDAKALTDAAEKSLEHATSDAIQVRERASAVAARTIEEAETVAQARTERADRRLVEAESGARSIRERVAEEVARSQWELHEFRRATKLEASTMVTEARIEADELRTLARKLLAEARAEVEKLSERRDTIATELGNLAGIIEALAVPDSVSEVEASGTLADVEADESSATVDQELDPVDEVDPQQITAAAIPDFAEPQDAVAAVPDRLDAHLLDAHPHDAPSPADHKDEKQESDQSENNSASNEIMRAE